MSYSSYGNLIGIYNKLKDSGLSPQEVEGHIADADSVIDMRLSAKYSVPFATGVSSLPPMVKYLSKNLALLEILSRPSIKAGGDVPGWLQERRDRLEGIFLGLENGSYTLTTSAGNELSAKSSSLIWSDKEDYHPVFTLLDAEQQQIDTDLIDELEDDIDSD